MLGLGWAGFMASTLSLLLTILPLPDGGAPPQGSPSRQLFPSGTRSAPSASADGGGGHHHLEFVYGFVSKREVASRHASVWTFSRNYRATAVGSRLPWNKSAWPLPVDLSLGDSRLIGLRFQWEQKWLWVVFWLSLRDQTVCLSFDVQTEILEVPCHPDGTTDQKEWEWYDGVTSCFFLLKSILFVDICSSLCFRPATHSKKVDMVTIK